jgi:hypothetical protein
MYARTVDSDYAGRQNHSYTVSLRAKSLLTIVTCMEIGFKRQNIVSRLEQNPAQPDSTVYGYKFPQRLNFFTVRDFRATAPHKISNGHWTGALPLSNLDSSQPSWSMQVIYQTTILGKRLEFPDSIPQGYKQLGERCLDSDPQKRPAFEELVSMLKEL